MSVKISLGTDGNPDDGARSTVTEQGSRIGAMAPILASGSAGWRHCSFRCTVPLYNSTKLLVPNGYDGPPKESVWVVPLHKCLESGGADPVDLVLYCGWGGTVIVLLMWEGAHRLLTEWSMMCSLQTAVIERRRMYWLKLANSESGSSPWTGKTYNWMWSRNLTSPASLTSLRKKKT